MVAPKKRDPVFFTQFSFSLLKQPGCLLINIAIVLRLYVATDQPSQKLQSIATFIMSVYASMWFEKKVNSCCKDRAKHIF